MDNAFRVVAIDPRLDIARHFQQTPTREVQLDKEVTVKLGVADGDLIEVKGKRTTVARIVSTDKDGFNGSVIGLDELTRNNARVSPEENVTIRKAEAKEARKIVLAPIGKHLKKSEFLKILARESFTGVPFVEGDVTYMRSKMLRYLLGSVTWLRVVKTDPSGVVVANYGTEFEIIPDPINQALNEPGLDTLPSLGLDDEFWEKDSFMNDEEREKINSLIELGLFNNATEAINFFLREGMKVRSDIFEKSVSVMEQIKKLKEDIKDS